ncbi:MAG: ParB N-terminal domain-containing protein [Methylotenera sp.]|nr:ParB N-terminal domain-containing protein [Methylotenera sp.]
MTEKYNVNSSLIGLENDVLPTELKIHPIANLFPEMSESQFEELKQDIAQNGLQMPILMYGGKVVDGRHRLRACSALGIIPKFAELEAANDKSVEQSVISINLHRRHLTESQKAIIGARLSNSFIGANQHTAGAVSQRKVAEELGISVDSVQRGKKVLNNGIPELIAAVSEGKIDISNAAKLAQLAKHDQSQLNFDDIKTIQEVSKAINKAKFEKRRKVRIEGIKAKRANNKPLESSLGTFNVIYADPPWDYMTEFAVGYPCMSVKEICEMPISQISADDAVLFMWCSSSLLPEAVEVVSAWGFKFKTSAVWDKDFSGQGPYFRQGHEVLMIATKGSVPEVPYDARPSSVLKFKRREHSRKPDEFYQIIDQMYPELSKVELFCRGEPAQGWTGWGNECTQQSAILTAPINDLKQA